MEKVIVHRPNIEINRAWVYATEEEKDNEEPSLAKEFVISLEYLYKIFDEMFVSTYGSLDNFLDSYEPETEGEAIYQQALKDGEIKDEKISQVELCWAVDDVVEVILPTIFDFENQKIEDNTSWIKLEEIQELIKMGALTVNLDKMSFYHREIREKKAKENTKKTK